VTLPVPADLEQDDGARGGDVQRGEAAVQGDPRQHVAALAGEPGQPGALRPQDHEQRLRREAEVEHASVARGIEPHHPEAVVARSGERRR
jgi:hypothetical protein